jgi:uncharacterized protein DUF3565
MCETVRDASENEGGLSPWPEMHRIITSFERDDENHWRAILDCGHRQHVRHDPPLSTREWVLTEAGRASRLGFALDCKRCDDEHPDITHPE